MSEKRYVVARKAKGGFTEYLRPLRDHAWEHWTADVWLAQTMLPDHAAAMSRCFSELKAVVLPVTLTVGEPDAQA